MDKEISVYVSASQEMDAECERIGQLLAGITRTSRSTIRRTPSPHDAANPDVDALVDSDFYIVILGTDLVAPMGVEWQAAQRAGVRTLGFRHAEASPSPAMIDFLRRTEFVWEDYRTPSEFVRVLEKTLLTRMIEETPGLGLDLQDIEEISARLKALEEKEGAAEAAEAPDERRGAARGGIILPRP